MPPGFSTLPGPHRLSLLIPSFFPFLPSLPSFSISFALFHPLPHISLFLTSPCPIVMPPLIRFRSFKGKVVLLLSCVDLGGSHGDGGPR